MEVVMGVVMEVVVEVVMEVARNIFNVRPRPGLETHLLLHQQCLEGCLQIQHLVTHFPQSGLTLNAKEVSLSNCFLTSLLNTLG